MNTRMISILMLLVVILGFSGVASASEQQVLVKEAYDEQVLVTPAWNETIPGTPDTVIEHPAVYNTVHHEAVYDIITVTDKAAWTETVRYNHTHWITPNPSYTQLTCTHNIKSGTANQYPLGYMMDGWKIVDDTGNGNNKKWSDIKEIIQHPAVTHTEQVLVQEAWDEQVLVTPAWTEVITGTPDQVIEHEAVYTTVHHEAEYKTVTIEDPVVPTVVPEVTPVTEDVKTIPMQNTGMDFTLLWLAGLSLLAGLIGGYVRRAL